MSSTESVACFTRCQQITVIVRICHSLVVVSEIPMQNICFAWLCVRNFTQILSPLYTPKQINFMEMGDYEQKHDRIRDILSDFH